MSLYLINPISEEYIFAYSPDELNVYCKDGKYGYLDGKGRVVIEPQFENAEFFHNGLACVKINNKYGFIDETGKIVIKPIYESAGYFSFGLARVKFNGLYNFINKNGKFMFFNKSN
jgi:hypothetical protein